MFLATAETYKEVEQPEPLSPELVAAQRLAAEREVQERAAWLATAQQVSERAAAEAAQRLATAQPVGRDPRRTQLDQLLQDHADILAPVIKYLEASRGI